MKSAHASTSSVASPGPRMDEHLEDFTIWARKEKQEGTLLAEETLWREAYVHYLRALPDASDGERAALWPSLAFGVVFHNLELPLDYSSAAEEALGLLRINADLPFLDKARKLDEIADKHNVETWKVRNLLAPGFGYPWMFPRSLWTPELFSQNLHAMLASFAWVRGQEPDAKALLEGGIRKPLHEFVARLRDRAPEGSDLTRMLSALASLSEKMDAEGRDILVLEPHAFIAELEHEGLAHSDIAQHWRKLLDLREAVVLVRSFHLYHRAESCYLASKQVREAHPEQALALLARAANIYKRLSVAHMYAEPLLERHQEIYREMEELRSEHSLQDPRFEHVLLMTTYNSPSDLQRLVLSVAHELMAFGFGKRVHVIVSDDSSEEMRRQNEQILAQASRAGMSISHWTPDRKKEFLDELNGAHFQDGSFDVWDLAGCSRKPGEKGAPYGRFRNFLRLAAMKEVRELGLEDPILTWLDHDNEVSALVLTRPGVLAKRHVYNYFDQKSSIFRDPRILVGGGGYTNDALEGVEKFWVAWGIVGHALELAEHRAPEGPPVFHPHADITRFRPWDQPDILERLPREGEEVKTLSDQFLLLLSTLIGTFGGKYDNQVQIYHPFTQGFVLAEEELLVEETRPFAGMPGGNTSFRSSMLRSSIPFMPVGGRGEDILYLWLTEGEYGTGSVCLTHTPAVHTRNVAGGRGDVMGEILDSYNGRIFREPPFVWAGLRQLLRGETYSEQERRRIEAETEDAIENLRAEAKGSIAAVSAFARALEPYVDEQNDFWWLQKAKTDPTYTTSLETLRELVQAFRDPTKFERKAEEELLRFEDVKELTDEFMRAYPYWEAVVRQLAGPQGVRHEEKETAPAPISPQEAYGGVPREEAEALQTEADRGRIDESFDFVEPATNPEWQEALNSSLLLFRRYEEGNAEKDSLLQWEQRVERLRDIYRHHAARVLDMPAFAWPRLFRAALLIPHSRPYQAVGRMLEEDFIALGHEQKLVEMSRLAGESGVDIGILRQALSVDGEAADGV